MLRPLPSVAARPSPPLPRRLARLIVSRPPPIDEDRSRASAVSAPIDVLESDLSGTRTGSESTPRDKSCTFPPLPMRASHASIWAFSAARRASSGSSDDASSGAGAAAAAVGMPSSGSESAPPAATGSALSALGCESCEFRASFSVPCFNSHAAAASISACRLASAFFRLRVTGPGPLGSSVSRSSSTLSVMVAPDILEPRRRRGGVLASTSLSDVVTLPMILEGLRVIFGGSAAASIDRRCTPGDPVGFSEERTAASFFCSHISICRFSSSRARSAMSSAAWDAARAAATAAETPAPPGSGVPGAAAAAGFAAGAGSLVAVLPDDAWLVSRLRSHSCIARFSASRRASALSAASTGLVGVGTGSSFAGGGGVVGAAPTTGLPCLSRDGCGLGGSLTDLSRRKKGEVSRVPVRPRSHSSDWFRSCCRITLARRAAEVASSKSRSSSHSSSCSASGSGLAGAEAGAAAIFLVTGTVVFAGDFEGDGDLVLLSWNFVPAACSAVLRSTSFDGGPSPASFRITTLNMYEVCDASPEMVVSAVWLPSTVCDLVSSLSTSRYRTTYPVMAPGFPLGTAHITLTATSYAPPFFSENAEEVNSHATSPTTPVGTPCPVPHVIDAF
mmetsp:Transcript_28477/g.85349  ORF Transcript_28477/g.85349 Transcript_28477/m.85349 type:complete len:618 (+) Transcript_28477:3155-5008(+)